MSSSKMPNVLFLGPLSLQSRRQGSPHSISRRKLFINNAFRSSQSASLLSTSTSTLLKKPTAASILIPRASSSNAARNVPRAAHRDKNQAPSALGIDLWEIAPLLALGSLYTPAAFAADAVSYNPQDGAETLKTVAGVGYIILVIVYFVRLFKKRADRATSVRISTDNSASDLDAEDKEDEAFLEEGEVTPLQCFIGFAQAGTICYLLYLLSTSVDAFFAAKELPTQYTTRNISVLVQTVARGLVYLITFIFGANAVGLGALGLQIIIAPDSLKDGARQRRPTEEKLPKVKLTDDIFAIRRAFKEAEDMGKRAATKQNSGGDSTTKK